MRSAYVAIIYKDLNDELKAYQGIIVSKKKYKTASYRWLNDSTAAITLLSRNNKKNLHFDLSGGYGGATSLKVYD